MVPLVFVAGRSFVVVVCCLRLVESEGDIQSCPMICLSLECKQLVPAVVHELHRVE